MARVRVDPPLTSWPGCTGGASRYRRRVMSRRLLPPSMPRRQRFETLRDAETRNLGRIEILANRGSAIAEALYECDAASPCDLPACARCALPYRIYFTSETLAVAHAYVGPHEFATIYLDAVEAGSLPDASLKRAHAALRKRLGSQRIQRFSACRRDRGGVDRRRSALDFASAPPGDRRPPRTPSGAASSEAWRFQTRRSAQGRDLERRGASALLHHQVHDLSPASEARPRWALSRLPAPPARLEGLATWWARHRFEDFAFLYGARRRGGRIALEDYNSISSALAAHDRAELTGALFFGSPDGVSAAADSRWTIRFDRVSRVGGRRRSAPSPATSTWPTRLPAYQPTVLAIGSRLARPDRGLVYLSTCLLHQSHGGGRADSCGITGNSEKRECCIRNKRIEATPNRPNSLFLAFFVNAAADREDKNTPSSAQLHDQLRRVNNAHHQQTAPAEAHLPSPRRFRPTPPVTPTRSSSSAWGPTKTRS